MNGKPQWTLMAAVLLIAALGPSADAGLRAIHRGGQTFVIFPEVDRLVEKEQITWGELKAVLAQLNESRQVRYRVYRHTAPITVATLGSAKTMYLKENCGDESAIMTVTPRRCQQFKAKPGTRFAWTLTEGGKTVNKGTAVADKWGLVTAEGIELTQQPRRFGFTAVE